MKQFNELTIRCRQKEWSKSLSFAVYVDHEDGYSCAKPLTMERHNDHEEVEEAFVLNPTSVQLLMDDMWRCGYRPSEGEGSAGQLSSVKYHLEDMRKLVFKETK